MSKIDAIFWLQILIVLLLATNAALFLAIVAVIRGGVA